MSVDYKIKDSLKSTKILILEDDPIMLKLLGDILGIMGFGEITISNEGNMALKELGKSDFDLIFCDWRMRGLDGLAFTRAVRAIPDYNKCYTPIIMVTGYARKEDIETARDAGVTEYMIKPLSVKTLCAKIKAIVENPRSFVTTSTYKGPDRRRKSETDKIPGGVERRGKKEVKVYVPTE